MSSFTPLSCFMASTAKSLTYLHSLLSVLGSPWEIFLCSLTWGHSSTEGLCKPLHPFSLKPIPDICVGGNSFFCSPTPPRKCLYGMLRTISSLKGGDWVQLGLDDLGGVFQSKWFWEIYSVKSWNSSTRRRFIQPSLKNGKKHQIQHNL